MQAGVIGARIRGRMVVHIWQQPGLPAQPCGSAVLPKKATSDRSGMMVLLQTLPQSFQFSGIDGKHFEMSHLMSGQNAGN